MNCMQTNKKNYLWILLIFALCLSVATFAQDARTFDEGVIINGVKWATHRYRAIVSRGSLQ